MARMLPIFHCPHQCERVALAFSRPDFYGTAGRGVQGCD
jgi:hypothetical protein